MWIADKLTQYRERRARRYLAAHPGLGVQVLRQDMDLAARATEHYWAMEAARGAPDRSTFQYPGLSHIGYGGRSPLLRTVPKPSSYMLRAFSEKPPARRALNCIQNPILDLPFKITPRRPVGVEERHAIEPTADQQARIVAVTEMLERPNDEQNGREFLEMVLEDILVLGGGAVEVQPNDSDRRPLFLWPVDAQSIRINANWYPGSTEFRYSQGRGYFYSAIGTTDQVKLDDDEMMYVKLNPRTSSPFGYGYLEVAFETVNAFLGAFDFATRRASNATPQFGIFLGENMTPDQAERWQYYWETYVEGYGKVPILAGGRQPSVFQFASAGTDPLWLQWQEWLTRIIFMSFGLSPMKAGIERDVNRSTANVQHEDDWSTIAPVANLVRDYYTYWLLWKRLGWTDMQFQWIVRNQDEMKQAQILAEQWNADAITVDEIRAIYNRPPLPDGLGDMTKTAYGAALRAASQVKIAKESPQPRQQAPQPAPKKKPNKSQRASAIVTPFDDQDPDTWSPQQAAMVRELLREQAVAE